ncbi:MAG: hypothetical protein PHU46_03385 [Rhodocyclaceae bacterium]|nr:hypothetical protein [Rhodocyclaceae bacterium]
MAATMMSRFCLCLLPLLAAGAARGESAVADPTRPPEAVNAGAGAAAAPGAAAATELVLQSVILPRTGRASAVISGQRVSLGDKLGDSKVLRIRETEVLLRGPAGEQHLLLNPAVIVTPVASTASPRVGKMRQSAGEKQ